MISFIEGSRKYKLTYGAVSISSCLVLGAGQGRGGLHRGMKKLWGLMYMFIILIVGIVSRVYTFVKMIRLYSFSVCIFLNWSVASQ